MFDCSGQLAQTAQLIMGEHFHNEKGNTSTRFHSKIIFESLT